ncbi:MAG: MFS transporter [Promethearchaeota archaeon]
MAVIQVDIAGNVLNWDAVIIAAVWLTIMMCTYETFLTLSEINYASLTPDLFREVEDRTKVGGIRMFMTVIGNITAALLITPVIGGLGGETSKTAYLITALIIAVISYILIIPFSRGVREPEEMKELRARLDKEKKPTLSVKKTAIRVFKDKNWMAIVIAFFLWATAGSCMTAGMNFFVIHSLGLGIEVTAIPALVASIVVIISIPLWVSLTRRIGTKKAYIIGFIFLAITYLAFFFVTDLLGIIIVYAFGGIGYAAGWGIVFTVIQAEAIDNAAVKTGIREEGSYIGILRIFSAFSYSFQTLIFAIVSGITGYNPAFETAQTEFAKFGLKFQMSIIPLAIILIAIIIFVLMYKITKEDAEINREKLLEMGL